MSGRSSRRLSHRSALVQPPSYTKLPGSTARDAARIEAWQDSTITLTLKSTKPIQKAAVAWPQPASEEVSSSAEEPEPRIVSAKPRDRDGTTWTVTVPAEVSGTFAVHLTDEFGIKSRPEPTRRLVVHPDQPPTVALGGSDEPKDATADDMLFLGVAAKDDLAVVSAEIHYEIQRGGASDSDAPAETGHEAAALPGLGTPRVRGEATLDLKPLKLRTGDAIAYRVRVTDSLPPPRGPNEAWTSSRVLTIVEKAEPLLARRSAAERARLQEMLDALKKSAAENRQATEQLRYAADAARRDNGSWDDLRQQELDRRETAAREVVDRLHLFANALEEHPQFAPLARPARQVADVEAEAGRESLDQARRAPDPTRRLEDLKQADERLGAVQTRLNELQNRFNALAKLDDDRRQLRGLAERQNELANQAAELAEHAQGPADRARLDQIQAEQDRMNRELQDLLRKSPELKGDVLATQAEQAAAMAERVRDLADRQREEARRTGDLNPNRAILRALAEEQREVENAARRLALDVDNTLTENERARLNTDALARAVDPLEQGNIEQSRQQLENAENELRRLARDLDAIPDDPRELARRLTRRQEELREEVKQAVRETVKDRNKPTPEEGQALDERLRPLTDRQEEIARLAAAIPVPHAQQDAARQAAERTEQAAESLREPKPNELENRQNEAREALNRLANALPDANKQQNQVRPVLDDAQRKTAEVLRDLERHLRETAPQPNKPFDPAKAAADLADRLAPLAQKEAEVAANLASVPVEDHLEPQRARAARRARALADALARAERDALPPLADDARAATERLQQKFQGRMPADDLAEELAQEMADLQAPRDRPDAGPEQTEAAAHRLANTLRSMDVPDARLLQAEAARAAEEAAQALADPDHRDEAAAPALAEAAEAADALARRLTDRLAPGEEVAALADAERHLNRPDAPHDPAAMAETQHAIDNALARVEANAEAPAEAAEPARAAAEAVDHATELTDHAADPRRNPSREPPTPEALAEARARAAERLDALAQALPGEPPAAAPDQGEPADNPRGRAQELARQQRELAEQIGQVHEQVQQNPDKNAALAHLPEQLAPLRARQEALAEATRRLDDPLPVADPSHREVERRRGAAEVSQNRAEAAMDRRDPNRAAELAREAAANLDRLAEALPESPPRPTRPWPRCRPIPPWTCPPSGPPRRRLWPVASGRSARRCRRSLASACPTRRPCAMRPPPSAVRWPSCATRRRNSAIVPETRPTRPPTCWATRPLSRCGKGPISSPRGVPTRPATSSTARLRRSSAPPSSLTTSPPRSAPNCLPTPPPTARNLASWPAPGRPSVRRASSLPRPATPVAASKPPGPPPTRCDRPPRTSAPRPCPPRASPSHRPNRWPRSVIPRRPRSIHRARRPARPRPTSPSFRNSFARRPDATGASFPATCGPRSSRCRKAATGTITRA